MVEDKHTIFISDLHLSAQGCALQNLFFNFLHDVAVHAEKIYILGDLFDIWVGKDIHSEFHQKIANAFKGLADKGISLYFMAGNRDFLLEHAFLKKAHIHKLKDPTIIDLYGKKVLLTHGDKLCTQDVAYQRYRKIAQNPLTKALFLALPLKTREKIALKLRVKSQQYQQQQSLSILDVWPKTVHQTFERTNVRFLLHGHVHRPAFHSDQIADLNVMRFVLGDWHEKASFIISNKANINLATYSQNNGVEIIQTYAFEEVRPGLTNTTSCPLS
ncbi:MAG: UDP-2,3-diacylglucosamine diphosphatase [Proteobacteria bacterium]|nr:UDP-2,3-diacylglucosamine diphosphatase [Pseudomonadota bacterium]